MTNRLTNYLWKPSGCKRLYIRIDKWFRVAASSKNVTKEQFRVFCGFWGSYIKCMSNHLKNYVFLDGDRVIRMKIKD